MTTTLTDEQIREIFLANGFTIKEGNSDLKPYVYAAARAVLQAAQPAALPVELRIKYLEAWLRDGFLDSYQCNTFAPDTSQKPLKPMTNDQILQLWRELPSDYRQFDELVLAFAEKLRKQPTGYVLVPVEATQEMINAAFGKDAATMRETWAAMIAAAPAQKDGK